MESLLLQAFEGKNKTTPVWFMRQAGRYLPEYQKIKKEHSLSEMFRTPELAAEITVLPVSILGVDAAILFSDILILPSAMGFKINYGNEGPAIENTVTKKSDLKFIHDMDDLSDVYETIKLVNKKLPDHIPLIGFTGSPFTVACYLIEGGSASNFTKVYSFLYENPKAFHVLMDSLTKNTIQHLRGQQKAGIKVFQIFDTWAGILRPADYAHFVLPYIKQIFKSVDLPSIYYLKNCQPLLSLMAQCGADFLSVCHSVVLGHNPVLEKIDKGIQGNLFNGLLYADNKTLEKEIQDVLIGARHYKKYIFNLSHGLFPDVDCDKVKFIVEKVHKFSRA